MKIDVKVALEILVEVEVTIMKASGLRFQASKKSWFFP